MPPEQVVFPYADFDEARKDKFAKVGGPAGAFRYMRKGFKEITWRKRHNASAKAMLAAHDAAVKAAAAREEED